MAILPMVTCATSSRLFVLQAPDACWHLVDQIQGTRHDYLMAANKQLGEQLQQ